MRVRDGRHPAIARSRDQWALARADLRRLRRRAEEDGASPFAAWLSTLPLALRSIVPLVLHTCATEGWYLAWAGSKFGWAMTTRYLFLITIGGLLGLEVTSWIAGMWMYRTGPDENTICFDPDWQPDAPPTVVAPAIGALVAVALIMGVAATTLERRQGTMAWRSGVVVGRWFASLTVVLATILYWMLPLARREAILETAEAWTVGLTIAGGCMAVLLRQILRR